MRKARSIAIIVVVVLVLLLIVFLAARKKPVDLSGNYRIKVNGEYTGTTAMITANESSLTVSMEGENDLRNIYEMNKTAENRFTILEYAGVNKISEYQLHIVKKGLEGTVWVLPVGKIDVLFEKTRR